MVKKGEVHFNWIFVLVAGTLFLFFFIGFGLKYKSFSEDKTNIEVLINFDNTLTALQSSSFKTFDSLALPVKINNRCGKLNIGKREITSNNIISSPKELSNKILIWYQPYKMPFKITNFYYVIPENSKYYLVEDSGDFSGSILDGLPNDVKKKFSVARSGNLKRDGKLIFLTSNNYDNTGILVKGNIDEGKIVINGKEYNYVGREMLYGAIFSDDYSCLLNKIQAETSIIGGVYKEKINVVRNNNCDYNIIVNEISKLQSKLEFNTVKNIDQENSRLIGDGCAGVF